MATESTTMAPPGSLWTLIVSIQCVETAVRVCRVRQNDAEQMSKLSASSINQRQVIFAGACTVCPSGDGVGLPALLAQFLSRHSRLTLNCCFPIVSLPMQRVCFNSLLVFVDCSVFSFHVYTFCI